MTATQPSERIQVRVCEAKAQSLSEITLTLSIGATLRVFGKKFELGATLCDGDRVELYRALVVEPKVARRRRAAHRQKVRQTKNRVPITDRTV